ncbi:alanine and proline-rich secreted protein Apa-like [Balaenoptera ricei]|uniref:alanine and proline-rich secreted protein Apa-like n=1 Tax=Balaenoptera ricei TaxID=2746895 RepID=UPI0028BE1FAE|nr:alanine and proline-rich secreted protein Apa-like [Balaenoptera ricei]
MRHKGRAAPAERSGGWGPPPGRDRERPGAAEPTRGGSAARGSGRRESSRRRRRLPTRLKPERPSPCLTSLGPSPDTSPSRDRTPSAPPASPRTPGAPLLPAQCDCARAWTFRDSLSPALQRLSVAPPPPVPQLRRGCCGGRGPGGECGGGIKGRRQRGRRPEMWRVHSAGLSSSHMVKLPPERREAGRGLQRTSPRRAHDAAVGHK